MSNWDWTGGTATVVTLSCKEQATQAWHDVVVGFLDYLAASDDFKVTDNGYHVDPKVLVTQGVKVAYQSDWLSLFSDHSGEFVLSHDDLSNSQSAKVCQALERAWNAFRQVTTDD